MGKAAPKTIKDVLNSYFKVDDNIVADFEGKCRLVKVKKNTDLIRQGDICKDITIVKSGMMRVRHESSGIEDTILFGTSGDVYASIHSVFASKPSLYSLRAVVDSEVWVVTYEDWMELEKKYPVLTAWMRDLLLEQLYAFEKRYLRFKTKSIKELFLNFLNKDEAGLPTPSIKTINKIVPLKYIAQYLSITPESLSRLRNKLVRESQDRQP